MLSGFGLLTVAEVARFHAAQSLGVDTASSLRSPHTKHFGLSVPCRHMVLSNAQFRGSICIWGR
jgi:hypothetical protein